MSTKKTSTKKIAFLGLMLALIIVLLMIERALPPLPIPPGHFKLGLSNVIVMYTLFFFGKKEAFTLAVLKAFFNVLMRGVLGGAFSLSGGLLSVAAIVFFGCISRNKASYVALSIGGAVFHNIGQLVVAGVVLQNWMLPVVYFPILLVTGTVLGTVTGILLNMILPIFQRIYHGQGSPGG